MTQGGAEMLHLFSGKCLDVLRLNVLILGVDFRRRM
jgi:hypothetical protein